MNKKILFLLPIFSMFLMGNTVKQEELKVTVGNVDVPVYNMEVSWNNMEFTYSETVNYNWNNNTHIYELSESTYAWESNENNVIINNKSYMTVNIELSYIGNNEDVQGQFNISNKNIEAGKSITSKLTLSGKLSKDNTNYVKVGSINLKFS